MPQSGFTPVQTYSSSTPGNVPLAANLINSTQGAEMAINIADGKLFYKNSSGVVTIIATNGTAVIGGSTTQVQYNNGGVLAGSANLTFNGTTLTANTLNLTNALGVAYGGTGQTTFTAGQVLYGNGTSGLSTSANMTFNGTTLTTLNSAYTGTLTGGTGIVNLGSGQFYKDASGNVGIGVIPSAWGSGYTVQQIGAQLVTYNTGGYNGWGANFYIDSTATARYLQTDYATIYQQNRGAGIHAWYIAPSGTAGNAISFSQAMTLNNAGDLSVGTTSTSNLGINTKFVTAGNSGGLSAFGSVTGSGAGAIDTGIPINQQGAGATLLFIASCNFGAGTNTRSAVYLLKFYYDGNNAPASTFIAGDLANFSFGVSGSNTLTVTNVAAGNAIYSWFGNK